MTVTRSKFCRLLLGLIFLASCSKQPGFNLTPVEPITGDQSGSTPSNGDVHSPASGWESSGGSGVACFESSQQAQAVKRAQDKGLALTKEQRDQIVSLKALEVWENYPPLQPYYKGKTANEILDKIQLELFQKYSPIFASRVRLVDKHIPPSGWVNSSSLAPINDRKPKKVVEEESPECTIVQIVVRKTRSLKGRLPETVIEYDQVLFEKHLDAFNQAVIIMHEYFYLIGKETGHHSSDSLRTEVAQIFSKDLVELLERQRSSAASARTFQAFIGRIFGDYYRFFVEDELDKPSHSTDAYSQYTRFKSFGVMLKIMRERKGKCLEKLKYDEAPTQEAKEKIGYQCFIEASDPEELAPLLNEEESFIMLSRFMLDMTGTIDNSEVLVDWNRENPDAITEYQSAQLKIACDYIITNKHPLLEPFIVKARRYCADLGL